MAKTVLLGMPRYAGGPTYLAARAFFRASAGGLAVAAQAVPCSLLAHGMNTLWCWALNAARRGGCDYFAMLHADVQPPDFWLDELIAELDATGLDVLAAVVPLKDSRGLTSTGLARDDGDRWHPHCRLTTGEVFRLPATFTAADVGRPLLVNTGCWACRFDPTWAAKVHFEINDRIVWDDARQEYRAEVEPEDWNLSRQLAGLGLRVGATRKIPLTHQGTRDYPNDEPWGRYQFDEDCLTEPVLPAADPPPAAVGGPPWGS